MSKKSQRTRRQAPVVAQPVRVPRPVRPPVTQNKVKEVNFAEEYHYVVEDLKRIAVIALLLLALLIILALLLG